MPPPDRLLEIDPSFREALLEAHPMPKAARYARYRGILYLGLLPLVMIAELDRELAQKGRDGAMGALAIDLFLTFAIATDLSRTVPRHPRVTALAFGATGARFVLLILLKCARGVHPLFYCGGLGAMGAALATFVLSPGAVEITNHLRGTLRLETPRTPPARSPPLHAAYALLVAAVFPVWLYFVRRSGVPLAAQGALFLGFALLLPWLGARLFRQEDSTERAAPAHSPPRIVGAAVAGLVLAFSLIRGTQHVLDAYAYAQRCADAGAYPSSLVRQFIEAERLETSPSRRHASTLVFVLATALLAPVAEELVYRRYLQRVLRQRLSSARAIAASATIFGLAHVFVYVFTAWQTVLLGIAFGVAFDAGGFLAAVATHVVWNLWLSF